MVLAITIVALVASLACNVYHYRKSAVGDIILSPGEDPETTTYNLKFNGDDLTPKTKKLILYVHDNRR